MTPLALRITNFRSFKKTAEFVFPKGPGLFFMQGLNEAEPQLEGNGAGKTTIWEALTWLVYGKTSKGLKAGDVNNWEAAKGTRVEFDFLDEMGMTYTIARNWKPNQWLLYPADDKTNGVDLDKAPRNLFLDALGLDFMPWLHCILMAQNKPMFLDLEAPAKASLFSEVMGLDKWIGFALKASEKARLEDGEVRRLERRESEIKGTLSALDTTGYESGRKDWEAKRAKRLDEIEVAYAAREEFSTCDEDLKAAEANEVKTREAFRTLNAAAQRVNNELRDLEGELVELSKDLARAEQDIQHAEDHVNAIEDNEACSQCGQRLSASARKQHLTEAEAALAKAKRHEAGVYKRHSLKRDAVALKAEQLAVLETGVTEAQKLRRAAEDACADARREKLREDKDFDAMDDEAEDLKAAVNPYDDMAEKTERRAADLRAERDDVGEALDEATHRQSIYSFWVKGFKEVRLQEISGALTEFEIEVNSSVAALGLLEWELQFQVDRETAKGTMQRGFSTTVLSPHNERAVPWEAWSGGEGQRLRLAANMGLADLIRSRTGTTLNLEVWDEPTQGLSPAGVNDLLESLAARARSEQRQIFIVDHRSHAFGGFAGTATVVKAPSGSRIRTSW